MNINTIKLGKGKLMPEKDRKGRRKRREYLEDFHEDLNGEYVYEGAYYRYADEGLPYRQFRRRLGALGAALLLAEIAAGCVPSPGMSGNFYVVLPYALGLVSAVSVCWALARLRRGGERLRAYEYEAAVKALPGRALLTLIFSALSIAGELVCLSAGGAETGFAAGAAFLAAGAVSLLSALGIRRLIRRCRWDEEK